METFMLLGKDGFEKNFPCMPGCKEAIVDNPVLPEELRYDYEL